MVAHADVAGEAGLATWLLPKQSLMSGPTVCKAAMTRFDASSGRARAVKGACGRLACTEA